MLDRKQGVLSALVCLFYKIPGKGIKKSLTMTQGKNLTFAKQRSIIHHSIEHMSTAVEATAVCFTLLHPTVRYSMFLCISCVGTILFHTLKTYVRTQNILIHL